MKSDWKKLIAQLFIFTLLSEEVFSIRDGTAASQKESSTGEYGYYVQLVLRGELECGGALIKRYLVVTAAHCFIRLKKISDLQVIAGTYKRLDFNNGKVRNVIDIIPHKEFNMKKESYDIGLVFLEKAFKLGQRIRTIPIPTKRERYGAVGTKVTMMGCGLREQDIPSRELLLSDGILSEKSNCKKYTFEEDFPLHTIFCVTTAVQKGTIQIGDSGGPLIKIDTYGQHILLGVTSYGFDDEDLWRFSYMNPSIFTDVGAYIDWIDHFKDSLKKRYKLLNCFGW